MSTTHNIRLTWVLNTNFTMENKTFPKKITKFVSFLTKKINPPASKRSEWIAWIVNMKHDFFLNNLSSKILSFKMHKFTKKFPESQITVYL